MTITALPDPPSRANSPSDFSTKADALLGALPTFVTEANALAVDVANKQSTASSAASTASAAATTATTQAGLATSNGAAQVSLATAQANAAAASAATAINAPGTSASSTTSLTIGVGSKTLTIQSGKALVIGMTVKIAMTASPTSWMTGDITNYDAGTGVLDVFVVAINNSGSASAWTVSLSGATGVISIANDQYNMAQGVI